MKDEIDDEKLGRLWTQWFEEWSILCRRYNTAFWEGASGSSLGGIILEQQKLMKKIPRPYQ